MMKRTATHLQLKTGHTPTIESHSFPWGRATLKNLPINKRGKLGSYYPKPIIQPSGISQWGQDIYSMS